VSPSLLDNILYNNMPINPRTRPSKYFKKHKNNGPRDIEKEKRTRNFHTEKISKERRKQKKLNHHSEKTHSENANSFLTHEDDIDFFRKNYWTYYPHIPFPEYDEFHDRKADEEK